MHLNIWMTCFSLLWILIILLGQVKISVI